MGQCSHKAVKRKLPTYDVVQLDDFFDIQNLVKHLFLKQPETQFKIQIQIKMMESTQEYVHKGERLIPQTWAFKVVTKSKIPHELHLQHLYLTPPQIAPDKKDLAAPMLYIHAENRNFYENIILQATQEELMHNNLPNIEVISYDNSNFFT
jgi:hypothetical protein